MDAESLGLVCKMLSTHEMALDMLSLHAKISDLVAHALAFIEDYDCETVGAWASVCSNVYKRLKNNNR